MSDQRQIELIQSYLNNSKDVTEKEILNEIKEELEYRIPKERVRIGNICPRCRIQLYTDDNYCHDCGQALD